MDSHLEHIKNAHTVHLPGYGVVCAQASGLQEHWLHQVAEDAVLLCLQIALHLLASAKGRHAERRYCQQQPLA